MKIQYKLAAIIFLGALQATFAGDQGGNGGGGVVCRNNFGKVTSVTVLDVYEAGLRQIPLEFGPKQKLPLAVVDYILNRMAITDPVQAEVYRKQAKEFFDPTLSRFLSNIELPFTEDTGLVALPTGCKLEQIVLQKIPQVSEDRLFTVNKDLWEKMDTKNQAALILHEIIYREWLGDHDIPELEEEKLTSFWARYYNEYLLSSLIAKMDFFEYYDFLLKCKFEGRSEPRRQIQFNGAVYELPTLQFEGKKLIYGVLTQPHEFQVGKNKFNLVGDIRFYDNGNVTAADLVGEYTLMIGGKNYNIGKVIYFYENGDVKETQAAENNFVPVSSTCSHQLDEGTISFSENGALESLYKPKGTCILTKGGNWQLVEHLREVRLHSNMIPKYIVSEKAGALELDVYEKAIPFGLGRSLSFHENGRIMNGQILFTGELFGSNNKWHGYLYGDVLDWTPDGKVVIK